MQPVNRSFPDHLHEAFALNAHRTFPVRILLKSISNCYCYQSGWTPVGPIMVACYLGLQSVRRYCHLLLSGHSASSRLHYSLSIQDWPAHFPCFEQKIFITSKNSENLCPPPIKSPPKLTTWKGTLVTMWKTLMWGLYPNTHISRPCRKYLQSLKKQNKKNNNKKTVKPVEGVAHTRHLLYIYTIEAKNWLSSQSKNAIKDNRVHKVYVQTTCTSSDHVEMHAKFQKDRLKPVGGVAHTIYILS